PRCSPSVFARCCAKAAVEASLLCAMRVAINNHPIRIDDTFLRISLSRSDGGVEVWLVNTAQIKIQGGVCPIGGICVDGDRDTPVLLIQVAGSRVWDGLTRLT